MQTLSKSKPSKQSFLFKYTFVKFKFKTAMAISLHQKITITFLFIQTYGLNSHQKNKRGLTISSSSERQSGRLQV